MKIKSLITVFGCILVSAAVFILGLCTSLVSYFSSIETVNNDLKSTTEYYSMLVKEKLELMRFQMEFSSRDQNLVNIRKSTTDRLTYLSDAAALTDYKNFKVAFSTGITYEDEDVSTEKFFLKSENEKLTYVTKPQVREDGSLTYIYSMYIAGFYHEFDLVLFGELPYSTIGSLISGTQIGSTGNGFIVDEDGTIIFHNDKDLVKNSTNYITMAQTDSKYANIAQSFEKMVARETGTDTISLDGTSYYLSYIPIEGAENWSYAVMVPVNEMMSSFYNSLMITFIVLIIMVVIGAITSIIVANRLSEPIVDVASRLELLAEGDLKTTLELTDSNTQEINRLYRSINKTLNRLNAYITDISRVLSSLANHDLTIKPEVVYSGDFSSINTSLVMICSSLNDIFGTLDSVSSDISSGSIVIADSSHNLAQSTKEQSENITALTASVDSITYQIKDTVEHTAEAHEITNLAVNFVDRGTERMKAMTHSMDKISESSNAIKKIAKTIEDIAFQTNILALNAAVEAARAGEAGKGFAVVADEVKNLASKSAEAAKTTSSLIKNTLDAIEKGTSRAEQASDSLKSITQQVEKVQDIIMNIKSAAVVESDSIDSVKHNLENINKATLTTSTASIESADASTKFSGDANTLSNIVKNFKLDYVDEKRIEIFRAHIEHNNLLSSAAIDKQLSNTNGENDDTEDPITDTAPQLENVEAPAESDTEKQLSEPEKPKDTEKDEKPAAEKASERRKFFEKRKAETTKNNKSSDKSKSVKENAKTSKSDKASKGNKPADNVKPNKSDKAANESKPADNAESVKTDKDANENKPADNTKSVKTDKVANESKPADNTKSVKTDKAAQENKAADNAKPDGKSKIEAKHETKEPEIARTEPVVRNTKITDITKNDDKY